MNFSAKHKSDFQTEFKLLSTRSRHLLMRMRASDIHSFKEQVIDRFNIDIFSNLRNCGAQSNIELLNFKIKIDGLLPELSSPDVPIEIPTILNRKHKFEFNIEFDKLSRRSKHLLLRIDSSDIEGFKVNVIDKFYDSFFKGLRNCGSKSNKELLGFKSKVDQLILKYADYQSKGFFMELDIILRNNYFKSVEKDIFENHLMFRDNDCAYLTLEELAIKHNYTRERIRQYRVALLRKLKNTINSLSKSTSDWKSFFKKDIFIIDEGDVISVCATQEVDFTKNFLTFCLSSIEMPSYNFYSISKRPSYFSGFFVKHLPGFEFKRLFNDVKSLMSSKRDSDIIFQLKNFIPGYYSTINKYDSKAHKPIIVNALRGYAYLLSDNKNVVRVSGDELKFKRTTKKKIYEYLVNILEDFDRPLHFTEIYQECLKRDIKTKSETAVLSAILNRPKVFGLKGQGIYGLRKWGGYFGSIGDVAEKKLKENGGCLNWFELKDFLSRELIISEDSVNTVLFFYENEDRFTHKGSKVYLNK